MKATAILLALALAGCGASVAAEGNNNPDAYPFDLVLPHVQAAGCNENACHGGPSPQEGLAFDAGCAAAYAALFKPRQYEATDLPRVELPEDQDNPEQSFTIRKILGELGHGGGQSGQTEDSLYFEWSWWLAAGAQGCE